MKIRHRLRSGTYCVPRMNFIKPSNIYSQISQFCQYVIRIDMQFPHHCGSLVEPVPCALFLPPDFCLFLVTKFLSRGTLQKYLLGYLPSNVSSGVPLGYFTTGEQAPPFQPPSKQPSPPTPHKCHIMCPKFSSGFPSFQSTFWGTPCPPVIKWARGTPEGTLEGRKS